MNEDVFSQFKCVKLGIPVYFWFEEENKDGSVTHVIHKVVGEYGSTLWTDDKGYGVRITEEMAAQCRGRVLSLEEIDAMQNKIAALKENVSQLRFGLKWLK